jgi:hypothetical protein
MDVTTGKGFNYLLRSNNDVPWETGAHHHAAAERRVTAVDSRFFLSTASF